MHHIQVFRQTFIVNELLPENLISKTLRKNAAYGVWLLHVYAFDSAYFSPHQLKSALCYSIRFPSVIATLRHLWASSAISVHLQPVYGSPTGQNKRSTTDTKYSHLSRHRGNVCAGKAVFRAKQMLLCKALLCHRRGEKWDEHSR